MSLVPTYWDTFPDAIVDTITLGTPIGSARIAGVAMDVPPRRTKAGVWGIVLCVIALSFVTALNWTPINYTTIFGLQGRYWLPVLPLVLALVHHNRTFAVQKPAERKAVFAMLCLTSFVILQGAGLYATFQMPS